MVHYIVVPGWMAGHWVLRTVQPDCFQDRDCPLQLGQVQEVSEVTTELEGGKGIVDAIPNAHIHLPHPLP